MGVDEDRSRPPFAGLDATFHETLIVERAMLAGEVQRTDALADRTADRRPLARHEAGIAAERPRMTRPVEARFACVRARGRKTRIDRIELPRRGIGLHLRRAFADLDPVPSADEIGENAGGARLHATRFPGRLRRQIAVRGAAAAMPCPPDALIEADHQLRVGAIAQLV